MGGRRRPGRPGLPRRSFAAVALAFASNGLMFGVWAARIPAVKEQAGLDSVQLGLAILCSGLGAVLTMPLAGMLAGRAGSHRVTAAALAGCGLALPAVGAASSFGSLAVALFAMGAMQGSMDVCMNANGLAVEQADGRPIMSRLHGSWSLGSFAGAALSGLAASAGLAVLPEFLLVAAGFLVTSGLLAITLLPDRRRNGGPAFRRPPRRLALLGLLAFVAFVAEGSAGDWSAVLMRDSFGTTEQVAALALAAFSGAMAVARFAGDRLTELAGPGPIVGWGAALGIVGLSVALGLGQPVPAILGFGLMGLGLAAVVPSVFRAGGSQPDVASGVGIAAVSTMGYAGGLVGPPLIGAGAGVVGLRSALGLVIVLLVIIAVAAPRAIGGGVRIREPAVAEELP